MDEYPRRDVTSLGTILQNMMSITHGSTHKVQQ